MILPPFIYDVITETVVFQEHCLITGYWVTNVYQHKYFGKIKSDKNDLIIDYAA